MPQNEVGLWSSVIICSDVGGFDVASPQPLRIPARRALPGSEYVLGMKIDAQLIHPDILSRSPRLITCIALC
jgi:hypothetical protein